MCIKSLRSWEYQQVWHVIISSKEVFPNIENVIDFCSVLIMVSYNNMSQEILFAWLNVLHTSMVFVLSRCYNGYLSHTQRCLSHFNTTMHACQRNADCSSYSIVGHCYISVLLTKLGLWTIMHTIYRQYVFSLCPILHESGLYVMLGIISCIIWWDISCYMHIWHKQQA